MANEEKSFFQILFKMYEKMDVAIDNEIGLSESFIQVLKAFPKGTETEEETKNEIIEKMESMKVLQKQTAEVLKRFMDTMKEISLLDEEYTKLKEGIEISLRKLPEELSHSLEREE